MNLCIPALLCTALVPLIMGFIWFHPKVLGTAWMNAAGMTPESAKGMNMPLVFGLTFVAGLISAFFLNIIVIHDNFVEGAMYYATNKTMIPEPGSELAKWYDYYKQNLAASNHNFTHGAFHGILICGLAIALPITLINALFERRGFKYIAIITLYWIVCFAIMGGITAAWRN